mgnify:CR=1 FL=1
MSLYRAPPTVLPSLAEDAIAAEFPLEGGRYAPGTAHDRAARAPSPWPMSARIPVRYATGPYGWRIAQIEPRVWW